MLGLVSPDLTSSSALYNKTEESILGYPHEELLSLCFKPVWVIWRCLRTRKMVHNQRTNDDAKSTLQGITSLCFKRGLSSKRTQFHIRGPPWPPWPPNKELYRSKMFVRIRYDILGILIRWIGNVSDHRKWQIAQVTLIAMFAMGKGRPFWVTTW